MPTAAPELDDIVRHAPLGVVVLRDGVIQACNQKFCDMFRVRAGDVLHATGAMLFRSSDEYEMLVRAVAPLLARGEPFQLELPMHRQDGSDVWMSLIGYAKDPTRPDEGTIWIFEDRTVFRQIERALRRAAIELSAIMENESVGVLFTRERRIERCNRRLAGIFGYASPEELAGKPAVLLHVSAERYEVLGLELEPLLGAGGLWHSDWIGRKADGTPVWCEVYGRAVDPENPDQGTLWIVEDIGAAKQTEQTLRRTLREMEAIMQNASFGVAFTRDRHLVRINPCFCEMFGYSGDEGMNLPARALYRSDEEYEAIGRAAAPLLSQGKPFRTELWMRRKDGTDFWASLIGYLLSPDNPGEGTIWICEDRGDFRHAQEALRRSHDELEKRVKERTASLEEEVSQRQRAEERLKFLALHDGLTGLPNRMLLYHQINQATEQAADLDQLGAVLFIDLDRFKSVNDSLGHHIGDLLLQEVARRISAAVRVGDVVARIGGDEFVVVASAVDAPDHVTTIARKIQHSLQAPIRVQDHELVTTPSIGIALFPRDGNDADTLLRNADTAMYQAKAAGRNVVRLFDPAMALAVEQQVRTESTLRDAIERGEFQPYYQPVVALNGSGLQALELLARWPHPELGMVPPDQFIRAAEEAGLFAAIVSFVLRVACRQLHDWARRGVVVPKLAVNLSALQFRDPRIVRELLDVLQREDMAPSRITLEIAETTLMQGAEQTLESLHRLAQAGFSIAIDDFGSGYSNLAYLRRFPVTTLKIDRGFVRGMLQSADDEAVVRSIIGLARTLGLSTCAEGVETLAQRSALQRLGCDYAQGALFGEPLPAAQLDERMFSTPRAAGIKKAAE